MRAAEASTDNWPASGCSDITTRASADALPSVHGRALGGPDQALDLFVRESGQAARILGDGDAALLVGAGLADPTQVESRVDRILELDGPPASLGVPLGQGVEPLRAHAHVRDLVGQHVVHGLLDDRIADLARDMDELIEDVAGQTLEAPVDS